MMHLDYSPKFLSLFSGAGLFDIGFERSGFTGIFSIDKDKDCCQTLESNLEGPVVCSPIEEVSPSIVRKILSMRKKKLDLLVGGPPCQPYSKSAYGSLGQPLGFDDHRALTLKNYLGFVREFLPKIFVIENVPQFISGKNERTVEYIRRSLYRINIKNTTNYKISIWKLNAASYGVPQLRERVFIVGLRSGQQIVSPEITHYEEGDIELQLLPYITSWDAIGSFARKNKNLNNLKVGGKWSKYLESIPPGENYLWHTRRGGGQNIFEWRKRYWNFLLKLHPLKPSWTIAAQPGQHTGPFHWDSRKLTSQELQALQSVPDSYQFIGSETSKRRQIGNGVPSLLGEVIGRHFLDLVFKENISSRLPSLLSKRRHRSNKLNEFLDI